MRYPMICWSRSARVRIVLCALVLAGLWPPFAMAGNIADDRLELEIDPRSGATSSWALSGIDAREGGERDLALPARRQWQLVGEIGGQPLSQWLDAADGWELTRNDVHALDLRLAPPDASFILHKRWRLGEDNWRADLELELGAAGDARLADEEIDLWLTLGPGLGEVPIEGFGIATGMYSFTEVIFSAAGDVSRERLQRAEASLDLEFGDGLDWAGLHSRYFALVLAPGEAQPPARMRVDALPRNELPPDFTTRLRVELPFGTLAEGESQTLAWRVFGGPKSHAALTAAEPDLGSMLFPGLWNWMRWLALGIMFVLGVIHSVIPSWGLAIILLAVLVRVLVHPVARNAMQAQKRFARMQEIMRPEMDEIRRNYKGGEQSERILQLYEKHKISPLAGLKPLLIVLIQLPIFVALFHLLGQVFELRDASFLWMSTLAEPDRLFSWGVDLPFFGTHFNLLPVVMAVTTMLSIKLAPAPAADNNSALRQNIMMVLITLAFFLLFYPFPSGMVLYWTMANVLHLAHGLVANRSGNADGAPAHGRDAS